MNTKNDSKISSTVSEPFNIEDVKFAIVCAIKVVLASLIIPSIDGSVSFMHPLLACWISYFVLGAILLTYLEYNPQYYLIKMKWTRADLYFQAGASSRDLFVVLPSVIWAIQKFNLFKFVLSHPSEISNFYISPLSWSMIPVSIVVGLIWRMTVHRILHHPSVYRQFHKRHHVRPESMTPFSSFNDHPIEFIFMEVVGTFFIPVALNPVPMPVLCIIWSWQCFSGILDHCNASIPGSYFVDAEYHFTHHQLTVYNYAELEILDKIVGTLYTGEKKYLLHEKTFDSIDSDAKAGSFSKDGAVAKIMGFFTGNNKKEEKMK